MLNRLVRRISTSLFQRPDRPWNDDPTSTAPSVGSKRRFTDDDVGGDGEERAMLPPTSPTSPGFDSDNLPSLRVKRQRVVDVQVQVRGGDENKAEEEGVKEVTEGVREVDITSQSSDNKDVLEDDVGRQGDEASLDNGRLHKEKAEKEKAEEKEGEKEEQKEEEEGEEEEASNVPLPDSPLLLPLPEQSLTPTSLVDPLATEPVECRGFEGGEAVADEVEGEEVGEDGGVGVVDVEDVEDVEDVVPKTVADAVAPGESASAIDVQPSTLTATTIPLETTTTTTTTTTSVAPPSESSS